MITRLIKRRKSLTEIIYYTSDFTLTGVTGVIFITTGLVFIWANALRELLLLRSKPGFGSRLSRLSRRPKRGSRSLLSKAGGD